MNAPNRTALVGKLFRVLRKHYAAKKPPTGRSVLDTLLVAACLEDAHHDAAEEAFAALSDRFFDWNEVRVTTIRELSEVIQAAPHGAAAADRLRRTLQSVFESRYAFDLENLRKLALGKAVKALTAFDGTTPFMVSYVTQNALGGHSIPLDRSTLSVLLFLGLANQKQVAAHGVPGLERAISKSRGVEAASLLHHLGVEFAQRSTSPKLHQVLLGINPAVKDQLSRKGKKKSAKRPTGAAAKASARKPAAKKKLETKKKTSKPAKKPRKPAAASTKKKTKKKPARSLTRRKPR